MFLFVGIGNIGKEYENTRHNSGFLVVDRIIKENSFDYEGEKFHGEYWKGNINCEKGFIIKPATFVNLSGKAVSSICNFYKILPENVYVFHDDIDLPLGKIKYKIGGSSAGHNGIKSIDNSIGNNYHRVRIGVGRPTFDASDYVLGKFTEDERITLENNFNKIINNLNSLLNNKELFLKNIN